MSAGAEPLHCARFVDKSDPVSHTFRTSRQTEIFSCLRRLIGLPGVTASDDLITKFAIAQFLREIRRIASFICYLNSLRIFARIRVTESEHSFVRR